MANGHCPNRNGKKIVTLDDIQDYVRDAFAKTSHNAMARIHRSAMTSPLLAAILVAPTCFTASYALREAPFLSYLFGIVGVLPILVFCGMYIYFGLVSPERLHSEEFNIRHEVLQMAERKGGVIKTVPLDLATIANPLPPAKQLTDDDTGRKSNG
jgi:hypothetical protein